jgi:RNA polymerase primary sigma factor
MSGPDPIRIISRIKNNRLLILQEESGLNSREFAKQMGIGYVNWLSIVSLKHFPGPKTIIKIEEYTKTPIEDLIPEYLNRVTKRISTRTISEPQLLSLIEAQRLELPATQENDLINREKNECLNIALNTLTPRESEVLEMRFGLNGKDEATFDEIALRFDVCKERLRQIEARALYKMRHPSRAIYLKDFEPKDKPEEKGEKENGQHEPKAKP